MASRKKFNGSSRARALVVLACVSSSAAFFFPSATLGLDRITFRRDGRPTEAEGKTLIEAVDGGVLLLAPDGELWPVPAEELIKHEKDDSSFVPLGPDELSAQLLKQLEPGFETFKTAHYLIAYNTSREYAQWCGSLFERLYRVFSNFWSHKGFDLHEPQFPLVAIVFHNRQGYQEFARPELKGVTDSVVGYYSLQSNRMTMFDLTGVQALGRPAVRRNVNEEINEILAQPQAEQNVATIIHEATHQIAFNCGLQTRYADIPLWVSEGIAVYFETPDLASEKGWRSIGAVNPNRLDRFRQYLAARPAKSLETLIADDRRFRDPKTAHDAYAEAWVLNFFLLRQRSKQYVGYLKKLAQKSPLKWDHPENRIAEFEAAFGNMEKLNAEMLRQVEKLH